jgi:hypothetical protein
MPGVVMNVRKKEDSMEEGGRTERREEILSLDKFLKTSGEIDDDMMFDNRFSLRLRFFERF